MSIVHNYVWNPDLGQNGNWERMIQPAGGPGGGPSAPYPVPPSASAIADAVGPAVGENLRNGETPIPTHDVGTAVAIAALPGQMRSSPQPMTHAITVVNHGSRVNVAVGAPLPLSATSVPAKWVTVQAAHTNSGLIAIGGDGVTASSGGVALAPGVSFNLPCTNLNAVFFDSSVAGGAVRYTYFN